MILVGKSNEIYVINKIINSQFENMVDMPDLSHLTAEERAIIEGVMMRQKQEEERENEIMR